MKKGQKIWHFFEVIFVIVVLAFVLSYWILGISINQRETTITLQSNTESATVHYLMNQFLRAEKNNIPNAFILANHAKKNLEETFLDSLQKNLEHCVRKGGSFDIAIKEDGETILTKTKKETTVVYNAREGCTDKQCYAVRIPSTHLSSSELTRHLTLEVNIYGKCT